MTRNQSQRTVLTAVKCKQCTYKWKLQHQWINFVCVCVHVFVLTRIQPIKVTVMVSGCVRESLTSLMACEWKLFVSLVVLDFTLLQRLPDGSPVKRRSVVSVFCPWWFSVPSGWPWYDKCSGVRCTKQFWSKAGEPSCPAWAVQFLYLTVMDLVRTFDCTPVNLAGMLDFHLHREYSCCLDFLTMFCM